MTYFKENFSLDRIRVPSLGTAHSFRYFDFAQKYFRSCLITFYLDTCFPRLINIKSELL